MKHKQIVGFETTDGKQFFNENEANHHQSKIDVIKKVKDSEFKLSWKSEVSDLQIGDLSIICELADIIRSYEKTI